MKKILAVLLALAIAGCNNSSSVTATGSHEPLKQTQDVESFSVTLKIVPQNMIESKCAELGVEYTANGCNAYNTATKQCTIYVMPQRYQQDADRLVIIGHELWHCRYGQWHD